MTIKMRFLEWKRLENSLEENDTIDKVYSMIVLDDGFKDLFQREFNSNAKEVYEFLQQHAKIEFEYEYTASIRANATLTSKHKLDDDELTNQIDNRDFDYLNLTHSLDYIECITHTSLHFDENVKWF